MEVWGGIFFGGGGGGGEVVACFGVGVDGVVVERWGGGGVV